MFAVCVTVYPAETVPAAAVSYPSDPGKDTATSLFVPGCSLPKAQVRQIKELMHLPI